MHLYDRLRNAVAATKKSLLKRRDDTVAYAKTLPTRAKARVASTTSRLGDSLVDLAAKLHEATTETKRQQWRRRIREWRQQVRIEELMLGDAKESGCRVNIRDGAGHVISTRTDNGYFSRWIANPTDPHFNEILTPTREAEVSHLFKKLAKGTGVSVDAIKRHATDKPSGSN